MSDAIRRAAASSLGSMPLFPWIDALPFGVCAINPAGTIRLLNREGGRLIGWQTDECRGKNLHELAGCRLAQPLGEQTCPIGAVLHNGALPLMPGWMRDRYDRMIPVQCGVSPLFDAPTGLMLFSFHDLRDQLQRDQDLLHLATMPEESPYPIVELNEDGSLLYANPAMAELLARFGYSPGAFPRLLPDAIAEMARACLGGGTPIRNVEVAVEGTAFAWTFCPLPSRKRIRGYAMDLTAIRTAERRLEASVRTLEHTNQALDEARRVAEAATQAKSRLLATMTHELRTPLNGMIGITGFLLDTALTSEQRQYAETILHSSQALLHVISDMLDASRLDAGKIRLEEEPFDLIGVIESVTELLAEEAARKGVELAAVIAPDVPSMVQGDAGRLRQVLVNLVGNALKFCDIGEVVVRVQRDAEPDGAPSPSVRTTLRFSVLDTGMGIPADRYEEVFEAYERGEGSGAIGAGLGLHICKQLVALMKGHIGVESRPGDGSRFWFTARFGAVVTGSPPARPSVLAGRRMLVVEDHEATRSALQQQAMACDMPCDEASDGETALARVRHAQRNGNPYDVILVDLTLPDMSGLDLADVLRSEDFGAPPVVLLTAFGGRIHEDVARAAGIATQMMKPVRRAHLHRGLAAVLSDVPSEHPPATVRRPVAPGLRVLIVEDHAVNRSVAVKIMEKLGCQADVAMDGRSALELWSHTRYDAVLMDCGLPLMDGYETTRRIREAERLKRIADFKMPIGEPSESEHAGSSSMAHVPIIALTANASEGHLERCLAAGMDDFLTKPLSLDALEACLRRWTGSASQTGGRSTRH